MYLRQEGDGIDPEAEHPQSLEHAPISRAHRMAEVERGASSNAVQKLHPEVILWRHGRLVLILDLLPICDAVSKFIWISDF